MRLRERKAWLEMIRALGVNVEEKWRTIEGKKECKITLTSDKATYEVLVTKFSNTTMPKRII